MSKSSCFSQKKLLVSGLDILLWDPFEKYLCFIRFLTVLSAQTFHIV